MRSLSMHVKYAINSLREIVVHVRVDTVSVKNYAPTLIYMILVVSTINITEYTEINPSTVQISHIIIIIIVTNLFSK